MTIKHPLIQKGNFREKHTKLPAKGGREGELPPLSPKGEEKNRRALT